MLFCSFYILALTFFIRHGIARNLGLVRARNNAIIWSSRFNIFVRALTLSRLARALLCFWNAPSGLKARATLVLGAYHKGRERDSVHSKWENRRAGCQICTCNNKSGIIPTLTQMKTVLLACPIQWDFRLSTHSLGVFFLFSSSSVVNFNG